MIRKDSPDWRGTKAWLELAVETARQRLESPDCLIKEADHLRGEIIAYRKIIAHVEPPPPIPVTEPARPPGTGY